MPTSESNLGVKCDRLCLLTQSVWDMWMLVSAIISDICISERDHKDFVGGISVMKT